MDAFLDEIFPWWLKLIRRFHPMLGAYYRTKVGENAQITMKERKAGRNPDRFSGDIYVLIGPDTYSSGTEFVAVIKDYDIGTLIGQATGGPANGDGNGYEFILPHSHLRVSSATNYQVRPSGRATVGGVVPDIEVRTQEADDAVLARAMEIARARD